MASTARRRAEPLAVHQRVVGKLDPLPAPVAVHGVVAARDRGDGAEAFLQHERLQDPRRSPGPRSASVSRPSVKAWTIQPADAVAMGHGHQRLDVAHDRMHARVGEQAHEMQGPVTVAHPAP